MQAGAGRGAAVERRSERTLAATQPPAPSLVGSSPAMAKLREAIARFAPGQSPVLIVGERGTGKELVARALHDQSRPERPFHAVNCGAMTAPLVADELFGHVRGGFTTAVSDGVGAFEVVEDGTLLLDEIGSLTLAGQASLLRAIESRTFRRIGEHRDRTFRGRIVAATNEPLAEMGRRGAFRMDLHDRLAVFVIRVPPLREHIEDVRELVLALAARGGHPAADLTPQAWELLAQYDWPGNVRELGSVVERIAATLGAAPCDRAALQGLMGMRAGPMRPAQDFSDLAQIARAVRALPGKPATNLHRLKDELICQEVATGISARNAANALGLDRESVARFLRERRRPNASDNR